MRTQEKLISRIVGIARVTDGNEHLITPAVTDAVIKALCLSAGDDEAAAKAQYDALLEIKRRMVPDCFLCANPCGKNDDLDLAALRNDGPEIKELKEQLLKCMQCSAISKRNDHLLREAFVRELYRGAIAYGMEDVSSDVLIDILAELKK